MDDKLKARIARRINPLSKYTRMRADAPADGTVYARQDGDWVPGSSGGISDGDYGDVVVSGGGTVWEVEPQTITLIENRTSDPASPINGQIWLRTDL